jgi:aminoglycoside phosphotransferase (APT) family kinase protein
MRSFFSDQTLNTQVVKSILDRHRGLLPFPVDGSVKLSSPGVGEGHHIVQVLNQNQQSVLIRIGLRGEESVKSLANEQAILNALPEGIAPSLYAWDLSRTNVSEPYSILGYCPGIFKTEWSSSDISRHAAQLARLHSTRFASHGPLNGEQNSEPFSMLGRFDAAYSYWEERQPAMLRQSLIRQFGRHVREILADRDHYFTRLTRFSLVHGDLHPLNIVISDESMRYIDWESAYVGDPAHDISMLGWEIGTGWQIALDRDSMQFFMSEYQTLSDEDESLDQRRDSWMLYTMFFDQIYHRTRIPHDPTGKQRFVVNQIEGYLAKRFGLESLLNVEAQASELW